MVASIGVECFSQSADGTEQKVRSMYGVWCMVYGVWCMVYGVCVCCVLCMAYCVTCGAF